MNVLDRVERRLDGNVCVIDNQHRSWRSHERPRHGLCMVLPGL